MRRGFVAIAAVLTFLLTGLLMLLPTDPSGQPFRFVATVGLVFAMCTLAAAIAVAAVQRRG